MDSTNCRSRDLVSEPPFDHSKLMVVDGIWSLIGSANWDPRSMQLTFEFNVEAYDADLAASLTTIAESKIVNSTPVTLDTFETARSFIGSEMVSLVLLAVSLGCGE